VGAAKEDEKCFDNTAFAKLMNFIIYNSLLKYNYNDRTYDDLKSPYNNS